MARPLALWTLAVGSALLLLVAAVGGPVAEWLATALVAGFPLALIALGAADRRGRLGRLAPWWVALGLLLEGSLLGSLYLSSRYVSSQDLGTPYLASAAGAPDQAAGLPAATVLFLCGAGVAALVLSGLAYALTFEPRGGGQGEPEGEPDP